MKFFKNIKTLYIFSCLIMIFFRTIFGSDVFNQIKNFSEACKNQNFEKAKEIILSFQLNYINSSDDLLLIFSKVLKNSSNDKISAKIAESIICSSLSLENFKLNQLMSLMEAFIKYDCIDGFQKIIDTDTFKNASFEDVANIIIIMLKKYKYINSDFQDIFDRFQPEATTEVFISVKNSFLDNQYRKILLSFFNRTDKQEIIKYCMKKLPVASIYGSPIDYFIALAILDERYIPIFIEASKYLKNKNILYKKGQEEYDFDYFHLRNLFQAQEGETFLLNLISRGFFNDSKYMLGRLLSEYLESLINFLMEKGSFLEKTLKLDLIRAILYQVFLNFSDDVEFKKEINKIVDDFIKKTESVNNISNIFSYNLKAYTALKDELVQLSVVDYMFFDAYLEYLKNNKQNLRNLVFPISKKLYILAPKKDSETQVMILIANSLRKIFKEDHIKYLLFDLVEKIYQKEAALDLLKEMGLISEQYNQIESQKSLQYLSKKDRYVVNNPINKYRPSVNTYGYSYNSQFEN